jgi:hypothetical protein
VAIVATRKRRISQLAIAALLSCSLLACNGGKVRQDERMNDFEATQRDFESIARAAFKMIETRGPVTTIVLPGGLDVRAADALRHVHPTVTTAPGAPDTLPAGYFRVTDFRIEDGAAHLDGQLGPATGLMTAANMPDCGTGLSISFYLEGGDWVSHAYKTTTCSQSRHWRALDDPSPVP